MGHRAPIFTLVTWIGCLMALAIWSSATLRISTDLSQFLPSAATEQDQLLLAQLRSGPAARTLLARITGAEAPVDPQHLADASRALALALKHSRLFDRVANGADDGMAFAQPDPLLYRYRYLLGPPGRCVDALSEDRLRPALQLRLDELRSGMSMLDRQRLTEDPTACYRALVLGLIPDQQPARALGVWMTVERDAALLIAITTALASDIPAQRRAVELIRSEFADLPKAAGLRLELAGPSYFAVGSEERIKAETTLLSMGASLIVALILLFAFRSIRLMLLGILPLASAVLVGVTVVSLVYGEVHGITLALAITLLGVAMDYPVHVYAHVDTTVGPSPMQADPGQSIWRVLLLGMATTVLGYGALAWTSFDGLAQLGLLAGIGLATAALTSRYLLPRLLPAGHHLSLPVMLPTVWRRLPGSRMRTGLVWLLIFGLGIGASLSLIGLPWETDIRRLSTVPEADIARDRSIRAQLGAPDVARLLYVSASDQAEVIATIEGATPDLARLRADGVITGFESVASWLPSPQTQLVRRAGLPDRDALTRDLAAANDGLPFRIDRLAPLLDAVEESRSLRPVAADAFLARPETSDATASSEVMRALSLRTALLLQPLSGRWFGLITLSGADHPSAVGPLRTLAQRHGLSYLDLRAATAALLQRFFAEALDKLLLALGTIVLVLAIALRDWHRVGAVLLPIGLGVSATFLIIMLVHGSVNLFHLVSLLLVVGLAIDYGLFLGRPTNCLDARLRSFYSVTVGAVSTGSMFGILAVSDIPALHAIGMTVTAGIACSYLAALLLARGTWKPVE